MFLSFICPDLGFFFFFFLLRCEILNVFFWSQGFPCIVFQCCTKLHGEPQGWECSVPARSLCGAQRCSHGKSSGKGKQSSGKQEVLWQCGVNSGIDGEMDGLYLFGAEPCRNACCSSVQSNVPAAVLLWPAGLAMVQGSSSCPQVVLVRSPEDSRPPSEEGLYCLKHCRQIQLCKSFVYMEKIGYVLYKGCSVRLETHSWKLQTACFGTCIYHSWGGWRTSFSLILELKNKCPCKYFLFIFYRIFQFLVTWWLLLHTFIICTGLMRCCQVVKMKTQTLEWAIVWEKKKKKAFLFIPFFSSKYIKIFVRHVYQQVYNSPLPCPAPASRHPRHTIGCLLPRSRSPHKCLHRYPQWQKPLLPSGGYDTTLHFLCQTWCKGLLGNAPLTSWKLLA